MDIKQKFLRLSLSRGEKGPKRFAGLLVVPAILCNKGAFNARAYGGLFAPIALTASSFVAAPDAMTGFSEITLICRSVARSRRVMGP